MQLTPPGGPAYAVRLVPAALQRGRAGDRRRRNPRSRLALSHAAAMADRRQDALDYHSQGRRGKIAVVPTKPASTQRDLSLAYSPGVAEPCREIARDPEDVFKYTAR